MRGITTAPAPPRPGTRDGLVRGPPEPGQPPHRCPWGLPKPLVKSFPMETPTRPAASPHQLLGWERRKDGQGEHHWESQGSTALRDRCLSGCALLNTSGKGQIKKPTNQHHAKFSELGLKSKATPPRPSTSTGPTSGAAGARGW